MLKWRCVINVVIFGQSPATIIQSSIFASCFPVVPLSLVSAGTQNGNEFPDSKMPDADYFDSLIGRKIRHR